jgi:hypothetical protein
MGGWMGGCKSRFKDCVQQSKINSLRWNSCVSVMRYQSHVMLESIYLGMINPFKYMLHISKLYGADFILQAYSWLSPTQSITVAMTRKEYPYLDSSWIHSAPQASVITVTPASPG